MTRTAYKGNRLRPSRVLADYEKTGLMAGTASFFGHHGMCGEITCCGIGAAYAVDQGVPIVMSDEDRVNDLVCLWADDLFGREYRTAYANGFDGEPFEELESILEIDAGRELSNAQIAGWRDGRAARLRLVRKGLLDEE